MRDHIDRVRKLFETPVIMKTGGVSIDFGLGEPSYNKALAHQSRSEGTLLASSDHYDVVQIGDRNSGTIDAITDGSEIKFRVEYETQTIPEIGTGIVQVAVWREPSFVHTEGLTGVVFFDYLLPMYGMMISDDTHTDQGKRFWLRMMGHAVTRDLEVGMVDRSSGAISQFPGTGNLSHWATEILGGWGNEPNYGFKRFYIRAKGAVGD